MEDRYRSTNELLDVANFSLWEINHQSVVHGAAQGILLSGCIRVCHRMGPLCTQFVRQRFEVRLWHVLSRYGISIGGLIEATREAARSGDLWCVKALSSLIDEARKATARQSEQTLLDLLVIGSH